jgi:hypothetical protein
MSSYLHNTVTVIVFIVLAGSILNLMLNASLKRSIRDWMTERLQPADSRGKFRWLTTPILAFLAGDVETEAPISIVVITLCSFYAFISAIGLIAPFFRSYIQLVLNSDGLTIVFVILALLLYRFRGQHRFIFGFIELLVGVTAVWIALHTDNIAGVSLMTHQSGALLLSKAVTTISGIYVMIRGLDNMSEQLPKRVQRTWAICFPPARR